MPVIIGFAPALSSESSTNVMRFIWSAESRFCTAPSGGRDAGFPANAHATRLMPGAPGPFNALHRVAGRVENRDADLRLPRRETVRDHRAVRRARRLENLMSLRLSLDWRITVLNAVGGVKRCASSATTLSLICCSAEMSAIQMPRPCVAAMSSWSRG